MSLIALLITMIKFIHNIYTYQRKYITKYLINFMKWNHSWEYNIHTMSQEIPPPFPILGPNGSVPCPRRLDTSPYPKPKNAPLDPNLM
jgi:hypothetical protein